MPDSPISEPTQDKVNAAAAVLIEAREAGELLDGLPPELIPVDMAEAQLVDDRVAELSGWEVKGWKIGCTSEHAQKVLGSPGPLAGRVYAVFESGYTLDGQVMGRPSLEGEFAFVIGSDIAPTPGPADRKAVVNTVAAVCPAIELVGGRFADLFSTPLPCLVADAGGNSGLILGEPVSGFDLASLPTTAGSMTVDGEVTGSGTGADVLGDPVLALLWLVDHLSGRGISIGEGQTVTTGTLTQISPLPSGATAVAAFPGLGSVTVNG